MDRFPHLNSSTHGAEKLLPPCLIWLIVRRIAVWIRMLVRQCLLLVRSLLRRLGLRWRQVHHGDAVGQDVVYVGRVRCGVDDLSELNLWLTSDNVRKGAALNAVQVAELLIKDLL